ncbi:MAG: TlpA family protein disulfide reductase [Cardiobacterium sp.]
MKKSFVIALALLLAACNHEETAKAEVGTPAPPIVAIGVHDEVVSLPEHPSRPLILSFWSATCGMCIQELQEMQRLQAAHPQAVDVLAVNIDGADSKTLRAVAARSKLTVPVAADQLGVTAERYRVSGTPTSYLIGRDGKIVAYKEGVLEAEELQRWFSLR